MDTPLLHTIRDFRVVAISALLFMSYLAYVVTMWFMIIKDPTNAQGAFASAVVLSCVGVLKYWVETSANNDHHTQIHDD